MLVFRIRRLNPIQGINHQIGIKYRDGHTDHSSRKRY